MPYYAEDKYKNYDYIGIAWKKSIPARRNPCIEILKNTLGTVYNGSTFFFHWHLLELKPVMTNYAARKGQTHSLLI